MIIPSSSAIVAEEKVPTIYQATFPNGKYETTWSQLGFVKMGITVRSISCAVSNWTIASALVQKAYEPQGLILGRIWICPSDSITDACRVYFNDAINPPPMEIRKNTWTQRKTPRIPLWGTSIWTQMLDHKGGITIGAYDENAIYYGLVGVHGFVLSSPLSSFSSS